MMTKKIKIIVVIVSLFIITSIFILILRYDNTKKLVQRASNMFSIEELIENPGVVYKSNEKILQVADTIVSGNTYVSSSCESYPINGTYPFDQFVPASSANLYAQALVDVDYLNRAYYITTI